MQWYIEYSSDLGFYTAPIWHRYEGHGEGWTSNLNTICMQFTLGDALAHVRSFQVFDQEVEQYPYRLVSTTGQTIIL